MPEKNSFPYIDSKCDFDIEIETVECRNLLNNVNEFITLSSCLVAKFLSTHDLDSKLIRDMGMIELHTDLRNTHLELIARDKKK